MDSRELCDKFGNGNARSASELHDLIPDGATQALSLHCLRSTFSVPTLTVKDWQDKSA